MKRFKHDALINLRMGWNRWISSYLPFLIGNVCHRAASRVPFRAIICPARSCAAISWRMMSWVSMIAIEWGHTIYLISPSTFKSTQVQQSHCSEHYVKCGKLTPTCSTFLLLLLGSHWKLIKCKKKCQQALPSVNRPSIFNIDVKI